MPAIAVGAISLWSGVTAFTSGAAVWGTMAGWAAGASIVGGATTLLGVATKNEKLQKAGMIIGAVGTVATMAGNAGMLGANFNGVAPPVAGVAPPTTGTTTGAVTPTAGAVPASVPASVPTSPPTPVPGTDAALARYELTANNMMKANMQAQVISGGAQAYSGYEQSKVTKEAKDAELAEIRRIDDRRYANQNNIVGLKLPRAIGQPRVQTPGLLNANIR